MRKLSIQMERIVGSTSSSIKTCNHRSIPCKMGLRKLQKSMTFFNMDEQKEKWKIERILKNKWIEKDGHCFTDENASS